MSLNTPLTFGVWGRFLEYNTPLFVAALIALLPVAVLQSLPVSADRRSLLRKCVIAGTAAYSVLLCIGLATYFTGILLAAIENVAG